ncbi:MAG: HisA/HisF-related TIM barrel protein [candidate division Zixibacteria bacterium]|nr:HisA/HisF-related TIM barrel protein [candidate division Zixibacteria bacterium]
MLNLGSMKIGNPIVASSGALAFGRAYGWERPLSYIGMLRLHEIGMIITKTLTLNPRIGNFTGFNPWQVLSPIKGGWVNAFGLTNRGIDWFIQKEYPKVYGANLVVSISGEKPENIIAMIKKLNKLYILGVEINFSCPNTPDWIKWQEDFDLTRMTLLSAKVISKHPIIVKIGYQDEATRKEFKKILEYAEIDAVDMINTIPFNNLYSDKKSPLSFGGGISGSVIKDCALEQVSWFAQNCKLPIIGGGGVNNIHDVRDFLECGATAVSIGSAHIMRPWITTQLVRNFRKTKINN